MTVKTDNSILQKGKNPRGASGQIVGRPPWRPQRQSPHSRQCRLQGFSIHSVSQYLKQESPVNFIHLTRRFRCVLSIKHLWLRPRPLFEDISFTDRTERTKVRYDDKFKASCLLEFHCFRSMRRSVDEF